MIYQVGQLECIAVELRSESLDDFLRAVQTGDVATVRTGLAAGIPVNMVDSLGYTPLIHAAIFGQVEVGHILLAAGANPAYRGHSPQLRGKKTTTARDQAR